MKLPDRMSQKQALFFYMLYRYTLDALAFFVFLFLSLEKPRWSVYLSHAFHFADDA